MQVLWETETEVEGDRDGDDHRTISISRAETRSFASQRVSSKLPSC